MHPKLGLKNIGKKALIRCVLYRGKAAERDFRNHLRSYIHHFGFVLYNNYPDLQILTAKKSYVSEYWEYELLYTDDALVVSENGERFLRNKLRRYFDLKEESIGT